MLAIFERPRGFQAQNAIRTLPNQGAALSLACQAAPGIVSRRRTAFALAIPRYRFGPSRQNLPDDPGIFDAEPLMPYEGLIAKCAAQRVVVHCCVRFPGLSTAAEDVLVGR